MYGTQRNDMKKYAYNERHDTHDNHEQGSRNYRNPGPLNCSNERKSVTMNDRRIGEGIARSMGQYSMPLEAENKRTLIINKSAIITVSVN